MVIHAAGQTLPQTPTPSLTRAFNAQYPHDHLKKWTKNHGEYIALFRHDGKPCRAYFTSAGIWDSTASPVKWTHELPKPVQKTWSICQYKDWLILDIKKVVMPWQTVFAIHIGQVQPLGPDDADIGSEYILYFKETGELLKTVRLP